MKIKLVTAFLLVFLLEFESKGQVEYDTIIQCRSSYSFLTFQLGNTEMSEYVVNENDISIRNGVIEKNKIFTDTIGLRYFKIDEVNEGYEIKLSDKTWSKTLFGSQCKYLENQIESYPSLIIQRNQLSKEITFFEPQIVGDFIKANYLKRIECIDSSNDKFMKKHLENWIKMIENDSINEFTTSFSSHFNHIYALFDIVVPSNIRDTVVCKISSTVSDKQIKYTYQTNKRLNADSTITYQYTDKVDAEKSLHNQIMENMYEPLMEYYSEEEKKINEIRINSLTSEDKSTIDLNKSGE